MQLIYNRTSAGMRLPWALSTGLPNPFRIHSLTRPKLRGRVTAGEPQKCILGIDNVGVATRELGRSVSFYQTLGFVKAYRNERGCTMVAGTTKLFIFPAGSQEPLLRSVSLAGNTPRIDHISFLVDDVDRTFAELEERGVEFVTGPADQSWGARTAVLRYPDGNNLYLLAWLAKK
jgi:methylmalonyl-CoA/ethylmalonyl-CoA epimerase